MKTSNSFLKPVRLSLVALCAIPLVSCNDLPLASSSQNDLVVASIKIVSGSIATSYDLGAAPDYSHLSIDTYNAEKQKLETLKAAEHPSAITYTPIVTSVIAEDLVFTVTYAYDNLSLSDSLTYDVEDATQPISWSMNDRYAAFLSTNGMTNAEKNGSNAFIKSSAFHLGTINPISLLPVITGYDPITKKTIEMSDHSKVSVKLFAAADPETPLSLSTYLDDPSVLNTTGLVDFKTGTAGDYLLTYVYDNDSDVTNFPEIVCPISVVEGYNITTAKELSAINNQDSYYTDNAALKASLDAFRLENGLPSGEMAAAVIQNDIAIKKSDIPDYYLWPNKPEAEGGPRSTSMVGTLKNQAIVFGHVPTVGNPTFNLYGNFHKVSLLNEAGNPDNFPFVEETDSCVGQEPDTNVNVVPEAGLFGNTYDGQDVDLNHYQSNISDLAATGNQGVSTETTLKKGGVIFFKCHTDSAIENVVVNSFFSGIVNEAGVHLDGTVPAARKNARMSIAASRFHDSFSAMIFNEHSATLVVTNSELLKAGGPLIINQTSTYDLTSAQSEEEITERRYVHVTVSLDTRMENWVTGSGGWFALYQTSAEMTLLSAFSGIFEKSALKKTLLKTVDGVARFNMVGLNMRAATTIGDMLANDGSLAASFSIGDSDWIDYEGGRSDLNAAVKAIPNDSGSSYLAELNASDYAHLWMIQQYGLPLFKTINVDGTAHYMTAQFSDKSTPTALINAKYLTDGASVALDQNAGASSYLSIYLLAQALGTDYNPLTNANFMADYASYKGVAPFGLIVGLSDYSAS